jgi:hypothetical protein
VGKRIELEVPLSIFNKGEDSQTYKLTTFKPSVLGMTWPEGYQEIPDPSWLFFENEEVTVAGHSMSSVRMFLKLPNEDSHYNQHWAVGIGVTSKTGPGQAINLAVYPRFMIETQSNPKHSKTKGKGP